MFEWLKIHPIGNVDKMFVGLWMSEVDHGPKFKQKIKYVIFFTKYHFNYIILDIHNAKASVRSN